MAVKTEIEPLSKEGRTQFVAAARQIGILVRDGVSASSAIIKVARDGHLGAELAKRLVTVCNTGMLLQYIRDAETLEEKVADMPLVSWGELSGAFEEKAASVLQPSRSYMPPAVKPLPEWMSTHEKSGEEGSSREGFKAAMRKRAKTAKAAVDARTALAAVAWELAGNLFEVSRLLKEQQAPVLAEVEKRLVSRYGDRALRYLATLRTAFYPEGETGPDWEPKFGRVLATDFSTEPYSTLKEGIALQERVEEAQVRHEKLRVRSRPETLGSMLKRTRRGSPDIPLPSSFWRRPDAEEEEPPREGPRGERGERGARGPRGKEEKSLFRRLFPREDVKEELERARLFETMVRKEGLQDYFPAGHMRQLGRLRVFAALTDILATDPVLKGYPEEEVIIAFNELVHTMPELLESKPLMVSILRQYLEQAQALEPGRFVQMMRGLRPERPAGRAVS